MPYQQLPIASQAKYLLTDSRVVLFGTESIFFAIKTERNDGHLFVKNLYLKGVREFVLEKSSCTEFYLKTNNFLENCNYWIVDNSIEALQELVAKHRSQFEIPVIGITGSNGKTIVKEWLVQLLSPIYTIVKSPKSYNSQIGVPLSVWQMANFHDLGVFEAGISQVNEMEKLEKVILPTIGILTNIGSAHNEFFKDIPQKINEKLKLFSNVKKLVFCRDAEQVKNGIQEYFGIENAGCDILSWSMNDGGPRSFQFDSNIRKLTFFNGIDFFDFDVLFSDEASIQNLCNCIIAASALEVDMLFLKAQVANLRPISMRLELKEGINNTYLVDDTYNNDWVGLKLAIDFLNQQKKFSNKVVILSDILQEGQNDDLLYTDIASLFAASNIGQVIGVGPIISKNINKFPSNALYYQNTEAFLEALPSLNIKNASVLVKGARAFSFERIIHQLQAKNHDTFLEIDLDAIIFNLNFFKQKIKPTTRIMAMVKAFAYGAGNKEVATILQHYNVDYLGVAYTDEGIYLRENGINLPIMVMNPNENEFGKIIQYTLEPEIYSLKKLIKFVEFMEGQQGIAKIHIKLDTGMHRLGFMKPDMDTLIDILKQNPNIIIATIFSHLVGSESAILDDFSKEQYNIFKTMADEIANAIGYKPICHLLNSSGISRFSDYEMDMVRLGVGMYGVGHNTFDKQYLQQVTSLKSSISQVKEIEKNETVGYGRKGLVTRQSKIATISIGYADGYDRRFGNGIGQVLVNGVLCPTIGNICMDMTMVDITDANASEGDTVTIFGELPTIYDLAKSIDTIPYEILTNVGERVKRIFYKV
jgi:Alr-MurF fusion protein